MTRAATREEDKRPIQIATRLSEEEHAKVMFAARLADRAASSVMRDLILRWTEVVLVEYGR